MSQISNAFGQTYLATNVSKNHQHLFEFLSQEFFITNH